jgi:benzil reductase ((S)-benzoin forming)
MNRPTVAIVTGASRGLGQALAAALLEQGAHVIALARGRNAELDRLAGQGSGRLEQIQADLADAAVAERVAAQVADRLPTDAGRYLLFNNAGMVDPVKQADHLDNADAISAAFTLNVTSVILLCSAFLRVVKPLGADARIVNISSGAGRSATPGWGVYCATKAALDHYTQVLHAENHGVRAVALAPGVIDTGMQQAIRSSNATDFPNVQRFAQMHEQKQLASPDDVAARILRYADSADFGSTLLDDIRNFA